MNTGRYLQLPAYTTLGYRTREGVLANKENDLEYIKADHYVFGFEYRRKESSIITIEGFYKYYSDYPVSVLDSISLANKGGDYGVTGNEEVISTGTGRAYGLETYVRERLFNMVDLIASFTLVKSEFKDNSDKYISSAWDNGYILNLTLSREFKNEWDAGLKWRLVGGTPYTPTDLYRSSIIDAYNVQSRGYPDYSRFNTERLEPFHQLDIRIDKQFFFDKWSLTLYTDVQNVYNYQVAEQPFIIVNTDAEGNRLTMADDPSRYQLRQIASKSGTVLPTVGIIVEF